MKAYKVELLIIDFEDIGEYAIRGIIDNTNFPNDCIKPNIMRMTSKDIGEWGDDHPLNHYDTIQNEYDKLFN